VADRSVPSPVVAARAAALLGWTPTSWREVVGGYTPAARFVAARGAERAFVKVATTPLTAAFLRREGFVYERLTGAFMPRFIGWQDDESSPILVIEDLSEANWPPPWDGASVETVLAQIDALHASSAPLRSRPDVYGRDEGGWERVARDPAPFLSLGLASRERLVRALPPLREAEATCPLDGSSVCHFDLRSDNICLTRGEVRFVDWPAACLGNPQLDLGGLLPSLCFEGGPLPEDLLPDAPQVAAWVSGYFAARAGLPGVPDAPFVRRVQREQLTTALPWVARALKLDDL
jgi:thiamine kinase-like enzyme